MYKKYYQKLKLYHLQLSQLQNYILFSCKLKQSTYRSLNYYFRFLLMHHDIKTLAKIYNICFFNVENKKATIKIKNLIQELKGVK